MAQSLPHTNMRSVESHPTEEARRDKGCVWDWKLGSTLCLLPRILSLGQQVGCEDIILWASLIRELVFDWRWCSISTLMCVDVNVALAISSDLFDVK